MAEAKIIPYDPKYNAAFKHICYEWLEGYNILEEMDVFIIENLEEEILAKGGHTFLLVYDGQVVGTVSLIKLDQDNYELSKLGVLEKYRGHNFGEHLIRRAIDEAKQRGGKRIILTSMSILTHAIDLYKKVGFKEIDLTDDRYEMTDRMFEMKL